MPVTFFPEPLFGWAYLAALLAILAAASCLDLRFMAVPKWLTVPALGLGLLFNVARGAWLGAVDQPAWALGAGGPVLGALDGLLFALAGFLVGFGLFFLMWILGVCGGGDVKLFAALGAWLGAALAVAVLAVTVVIVCVFVFFRVMAAVFGGNWKLLRQGVGQPGRRPRPGQAGRQPRRRALGFALPLAVATALVLPYVFRVELHFVNPPEPVRTAHAR
jgi:Flp pilus assembly protein protease CpaA